MSVIYYLSVIPYTLKRDYIRLAAITYQSFGMDKKRQSKDCLFLVRCEGLKFVSQIFPLDDHSALLVVPVFATVG